MEEPNCPYCGKPVSSYELEEFNEGEKEIDCENCGGVFELQAEVSVDYYTVSDCENSNGQQNHSWKAIYMSNGEITFMCKNCDKWLSIRRDLHEFQKILDSGDYEK